MQELRACSKCHEYKEGESFISKQAQCSECRRKRSQLYAKRLAERKEITHPKDQKCSACEEVRPAGDFGLCKTRVGGLDCVCKRCKDKANIVFRKRRRDAVEEYRGKVCVNCGETDPDVLESDHIDASKKTDNFSTIAMKVRKEVLTILLQ